MPADAASRTPAQQATWLLAQILGFHRREDKAVWWEFYRLTDLDDEQLLDEKEALVGLEFVEQVFATKKTVTNRYRFPPQEADIRENAEALTSADHKLGAVVGVRSRRAGRSTSSTRRRLADERPTRILTRQIVNTDVLSDSLYRIGEWVAENGIAGPGPFLAARRLLLRASPVLSSGNSWIVNGEDDVARAKRLAVSLDESTLAIQGPPGAGKTYTGAQIICELVKAGKTVGVARPATR